MLTCGVRPCIERQRRRTRLMIGMDSDTRKVASETPLHSAKGRSRQRFAGRRHDRSDARKVHWRSARPEAIALDGGSRGGAALAAPAGRFARATPLQRHRRGDRLSLAAKGEIGKAHRPRVPPSAGADGPPIAAVIVLARPLLAVIGEVSADAGSARQRRADARLWPNAPRAAAARSCIANVASSWSAKSARALRGQLASIAKASIRTITFTTRPRSPPVG